MIPSKVSWKSEKIRYLVHDSAKIEYNSEGILIIDLQKMIREDEFTKEQLNSLMRVRLQQLEKPKVFDIFGVTLVVVIISTLILVVLMFKKKFKLKNKNN